MIHAVLRLAGAPDAAYFLASGWSHVECSQAAWVVLDFSSLVGVSRAGNAA
jgi:hypothetical protein